MPAELFEYVVDWLRDERNYQVEKFGLTADDTHTEEHPDLAGWWDQQLNTYIGRARTLGLETPGGRQAFAKFVATSLGLLESAIRLFGPLPEPGVPSGYNLDLLRPVTSREEDE